MLKLKTKLSQPRIKADGTGSITVHTLIGMNKEIFDWVSEKYFEKRDVIVLFATEEDYGKLITTEAIKLASEEE